MSAPGSGPGPVVKIVGGLAVFVVCWIVQATMGDSSMFSMTYADRGFLQGLLVNVTFWPGWILTGVLIGGGIVDLVQADEDGGNARPWETE